MPSVLYRVGLSLLVLWSTLRIILYGLLDRRPLIGFEAADLQRSMFYHYGLRGHLDYGFIEQISRDGFKPPLWYGGVPLLFSWRDTMSSLDFLWVNAFALLVACLAVWLLGKRVGGELAGGLSVLCLCALPGLAGSATLIGVEMSQVAFFAWLMFLLVDLQGGSADVRRHLLFGGLFGLGMLAKWNLVIYLALPIAWTAWSLRPAGKVRPRSLRHFGLALALSALIFLAWLVPCADLLAIARGAGGEASYPSVWSAGSLLFYPRAVLHLTVGWAALPALLLAVLGLGLGWRARAAERERRLAPAADRDLAALWLCGLALFSSLFLLSFVPHKELRYLGPLLPSLAVLIGCGMAALCRARRRIGRLAIAAACSWMVTSTLVVPWTQLAATQNDATLHFEELRFAPHAEDYGLDFTVRDASLREAGFAIVTYSVVDLDSSSLQWALYDRNEVPVVSRYNHVPATSDACRYDLVRSSHFVTNRVLSTAEVDTITGLGFELRSQSSPRIEYFGALQLWQRVGRWQ